VHEELRRKIAVAVRLCPNEKFLNRFMEAEGKTFWTPALFASPNKPGLPHLARFIFKLCSLDQSNQLFEAYAVSIEGMAVKGAVLASWKRTMEYAPCDE
jgi:hypothetical protein